jgi:hypothetical protein
MTDTQGGHPGSAVVDQMPKVTTAPASGTRASIEGEAMVPRVRPPQNPSYLTENQVNTLLRRLHPSRIERRTVAGMQLSYLNQADVRAHLTRMFGFARWSADVLDTQLLFEETFQARDPKTGVLRVDKYDEPIMHWYVAWRVTLRLTICAPDGEWLATYTETAIGGATLPQRHEALDMALKTAESDALKRSAANLGDQFGLGLYQKGSTKPIVGVTLNHPGGDYVVELPEPEVDPAADEKLAHAVGLQPGELASVSDYG